MTSFRIDNALRVLTFIVLAVLAAVFQPVTAQAVESDWAVTDGGRMRLILAGDVGGGLHEGALEIEPEPGWITYWREPGDSGIPPQITVAPGSPLQLHSVDFPAPKRIDNGKVSDLAYDGPVTLPLVFEGDGNAAGKELQVHVFIGICKNICIPFQAEFKVTVPTGSDPQDAIRIRMARQALPDGPSKDFALSAVQRSDDGKALLIDLLCPGNDPKDLQIYVTGKPGTVAMDYTVEKSDGHRMLLRVPVSELPDAGDPDGRVFRLLAIDGKRTMRTPLAFN